MKRRIAGAFAGFLAVMLLFTVLSRAADSITVARVTVQRAHEGRIAHRVSGSGKVEQNREQAVSTLPGQIVRTIYVEEGQQVSAGDLLFEVDLESLQEQILEKRQEMKISDLQAQDRASQLDAQAQQEAVARDRAAEDYRVASDRENTAVNRAAQELKRAKKKLAALKSSADSASGNDSVQLVLEQTCREKQEDYRQAIAYREKLMEKIDQAVADALEQNRSRLVGRERRTTFAAEDYGGTMDASLPALSDSLQMDAGAPQGEQSVSDISGTAEDVLRTETSAWDAPLTDVPLSDAPLTDAPLTDTPQTDAPFPVISDAPQTDVGETAQTEDPWLLEQRIRLENQPLLDEAEEQIRIAKQEKQEAELALEVYQQQKAAGMQTSVETMRAQIQEEIRTKRQAYEDAVAAANDALRTAGRAVEDASAPKGSDSTVEIDAITREQQELQLDKLERLQAAEGRVTAPIDGVVSRINLTTGDRTPDGTAILLSDRASGCKLVVQVPKEQEDYIARNDAVKVKTTGKKELEGLTVDSMRENEEDGTLLDVTVQLPADALEAGVAATMESERISELYRCCVPLQALYEESGKYFVYVLAESNSILGTELTAQRLDVTVLEKNETDAALLEGSIGGDRQVIVSTDKLLANGSRVRLAE